MCPGQFRETSMAYMGPLTTDFIAKFKIDILFLGVEGIDLLHGVSVPDILDGATKKVLVEKAEKVICVADSSKFNKSFLFNICNFDKIDFIITDENLDKETKTLFDKHSIPLIIASNKNMEEDKINEK